MTTFIDSNVLIAIFNKQEKDHVWASGAIETCKSDGPAIITNIVYCEISIAIESREELEDRLRNLDIEIIPEDPQALFRAGKAFKHYKTNGGQKGVLPDLLIGAAAAVNDAPLITADTRRYKTYFPDVKLITPP